MIVVIIAIKIINGIVITIIKDAPPPSTGSISSKGMVKNPSNSKIELRIKFVLIVKNISRKFH